MDFLAAAAREVAMSNWDQVSRSPVFATLPPERLRALLALPEVSGGAHVGRAPAAWVSPSSSSGGSVAAMEAADAASSSSSTAGCTTVLKPTKRSASPALGRTFCHVSNSGSEGRRNNVRSPARKSTTLSPQPAKARSTRLVDGRGRYEPVSGEEGSVPSKEQLQVARKPLGASATRPGPGLPTTGGSDSFDHVVSVDTSPSKDAGRSAFSRAVTGSDGGSSGQGIALSCLTALCVLLLILFGCVAALAVIPVSYTHLTLPTKRIG